MKLRRLAGVCGQQAYAGMVAITGSLDKGDIVTVQMLPFDFWPHPYSLQLVCPFIIVMITLIDHSSNKLLLWAMQSPIA